MAMFNRLFGSPPPPPPKAKGFNRANALVLGAAVNIKKELDRTASNPEIDQILLDLKDLEYLRGLRNTIVVGQKVGPYKSAYAVIPVVSNMFMTMADHVLPPRKRPSGASFRDFVNAYEGEERQSLLRFACVATGSEQAKSSNHGDTAYALRVVLAAVGANADPRPAAQAIARELAELIDELSLQG
jgi:hypothetical protein